jgi:hypothetical protein
VYSVICQNQRQPLIYAPEELANLTRAEERSLTKYWNFTLNRAAYYGCPDKRYPYLSFITGVHPKGYCLPCCNKKPPLDNIADSRRATAHRACLRDHEYKEDDEASSRHVMGYGKSLDPGRISRCPGGDLGYLLSRISAALYSGTTSAKNASTHSAKNDNGSTKSDHGNNNHDSAKNGLVGPRGLSENPAGFYLCGVRQCIAGETAPLLCAIAAALDEEPRDVVMKVVKSADALEPVFQRLVGGTAATIWRDPADMLASVNGSFVRVMPGVQAHSVMTPPGWSWSRFFAEVCSLLYNIIIHIITDTDGALSLRAVDLTNLAGDPMSETRHAVVVARAGALYPMFALQPEIYFRTSNVIERTFAQEHPVVQLLQSAQNSGESQYNFLGLE